MLYAFYLSLVKKVHEIDNVVLYDKAIEIGDCSFTPKFGRVYQRISKLLRVIQTFLQNP